MKSENEVKKIEEKLLNINEIYIHAGIFLPTDKRQVFNIFILLVVLIYFDYSEANLKEILKRTSKILNIKLSKLEDMFKINELESRSDSSNVYANIMDIIISFKEIKEYAINDYIFENRLYYGISHSLGSFSANILGQVSNAKLLDVYSGNGYFDGDYLRLNGSAQIDGYEINEDCVDVAKAINYILNRNKYKNCNYIQADFLTADLKENYYDLVFADCPIGLKYDRNNISNIESAIKFVKNNIISIPWLTALKIEKCLKDKGKAVIVCSAGSLFGIVDKEVRKYFVEKNLISHIIELPNNINLYSSIKLYLIVMEKGRKDKSIKFSNISDFITKERRINKINVLDALHEVENNFIEVDIKEIEKNNYILDINRYISNDKISIENGIMLKKISEKIFRGYQFTASQIDEMYTTDEKKSNYKILEVGNIDNLGNIDNNLKLIDSGSKDLSKHLLQNNDIILSAKGSNTKIAIIENINNNDKIIPSGSLVVIRLNKNKMIPIYLKAFLESEVGQMILNSAKTGIVIPSIVPSSLAKIIVKCPSMQEQEEFVDKYMIKYYLYKEAEEKMNKYLEELKALINQI